MIAPKSTLLRLRFEAPRACRPTPTPVLMLAPITPTIVGSINGYA
jgi:hypothetical protein